MTHVSTITRPPVNSQLSEHAQKLVEYSQEIRRQRPEESDLTCVEIGLGRLEGEYDNDTLIAYGALAEIAALSMFK